MLFDIVGVLSIRVVLICICFLFLRQICSFMSIKEDIVLFNRLYLIDVICLVLSILVTFVLFSVYPNR